MMTTMLMTTMTATAMRARGGKVRQRARVFQNGGSQAVRLPRDFRFLGDEVSIRREGDRVILEPLVGGYSTSFRAMIEGARDDSMPARDQGAASDKRARLK